MLANSMTDPSALANLSVWLNPLVTLGGVALTALVSGLIYWRTSKRSDKLHEEELERLRDEARAAEMRHVQQMDAMLAQGRRQREVAFLRELSDYLLEFASKVPTGLFTSAGPSIMLLRQYSLKMHADFSEDDPEFAENVSRFLLDIAKKAGDSHKGSTAYGEVIDQDTLAVVSLNAEKGGFYLLRWLNPAETQDSGQAFENYRRTGEFEQVADTTK